jgi:hypothetical protein
MENLESELDFCKSSSIVTYQPTVFVACPVDRLKDRPQLIPHITSQYHPNRTARIEHTGLKKKLCRINYESRRCSPAVEV